MPRIQNSTRLSATTKMSVTRNLHKMFCGIFNLKNQRAESKGIGLDFFCENCMILTSAVFSQYTRVTDNKQYIMTIAELVMNCNVPLKSGPYCPRPWYRFTRSERQFPGQYLKEEASKLPRQWIGFAHQTFCGHSPQSLTSPLLPSTSNSTLDSNATILHCVSKKLASLRQVGINSVIFQIQKNRKYTFCREFHSE